MEPTCVLQNRWVSFDIGNTLALYHSSYDEALLESGEALEHFNEEYIADFLKKDLIRKNNIVTLNFEVEDIEKEYERVTALKLGEGSELLYVNVARPYWYFTLLDPDGTVLEITGSRNK